MDRIIAVSVTIVLILLSGGALAMSAGIVRTRAASASVGRSIERTLCDAITPSPALPSAETSRSTSKGLTT